MESLWNAVRSKVSGDKNRYLNGNFDLDLTYITDRIIAMSFPAEGVVESTYRNRIDDVAQMLQKNHGNNFMIYNLSERKYDISKFENQVNHDWCSFPDHHAPQLEIIFLVVRSMHSWLISDRKHVVIIHCLAGKGRTGTIIASYFLWCGLFNNAEESLNFFACKRSSNNWGVTVPSQIRYVNYFSDIVNEISFPVSKVLHLVYLNINMVPSFSINPLNRQGGCTPFIHVYQLFEGKKLVYSSEHDNEEIKSFCPGQSVTFQIDHPVSGDILIEMYHVTSFYRTEHMLRFQFHTGMIRGSIVRFTRNEIDQAFQDKRFPPDFMIELGFEHLPEKSENEERRYWEGAPKDDKGKICFFDEISLSEAKSISNIQRTKVERGGYLTKRGHQVKNWKRRWFVLKDPTLCYFKSPRDTTPAGVIILDDILTIISEKNIYKDIKPADRPNFWFEIVTKKKQLPNLCRIRTRYGRMGRSSRICYKSQRTTLFTNLEVNIFHR